ncbi:MAG: cbb3-type cytochrome oxidase assembly protein CcoS [Alphaproteobacteria bacterium]|nr:cbb3-type cytochrome oxidase assembly protein CcoS [Alphaproteobacteria bacterium]
MSVLIYMIPLALLIGIGWLCAFLWSIRGGQYEDMEGAANRILLDDENPPEN